MSRAEEFADAYAASQRRLLLQLYAYCGRVEIAQDALDEAFIAASWHWHRVGRLATIDGWLRERAIKRIDRRPQALRDAAGTTAHGTTAHGTTGHGTSARSRRGPRTRAELATSGVTPRGTPGSGRNRGRAAVPTRSEGNTVDNAHLLAVLGTLDPVSRRLLIVRRLDDSEFAAAAREVGLSDAAAEQALARAITSLHAAGLDSTPSGLSAHFERLADDLGDREPSAVDALRRAGTRRRYAMATVIGVGLLAVAGGAGALTAVGPFAHPAAAGHTLPTTSSHSVPTAPATVLGAPELLSAAVVGKADPGGGWQALPNPRQHARPTNTSIYGSCMMAADDPPPETSWTRDFVPQGLVSIPADRPLRQVLLQAPSVPEAQRTFRQLTHGFASCAGHQLVDYRSVGGLGDRARIVNLRYALPGGPVRQAVLIVETGPAVTVLNAKSAPGRPPEFDTAHLTALAASAVDNACSKLSSRCAVAPYPVSRVKPLGDGTPGGFLSIVDLPLVPGITAAWAATVPTSVAGNPSATVCDRADFTAAGATAVSSRSYLMPDATKLPAAFGLTETIGQFGDPASAQAFVARTIASVQTCHQRHPTITLRGSTPFTTNLATGRVWRIRQQVSPTRSTVLRIALVRHGAAVAEMTLTPAGKYDIKQPEYVASARRAGLRLDT